MNSVHWFVLTLYALVVEFFFERIVILLVGAIIKGKACKDIFGLATQSVKYGIHV